MPCFTISTPEQLHKGSLQVCYGDAGITAIDLLGPVGKATAPANEFETRLLAQFTRYFSQPEFVFELPLSLAGTDYQRRVWEALRAIPSGEVRSYGELAAQLGSSARAVGGACRRNPVPIIVPCHRVVARSGIGGFGGAVSGGLIEQKRQLLRHEGVEF